MSTTRRNLFKLAAGAVLGMLWPKPVTHAKPPGMEAFHAMLRDEGFRLEGDQAVGHWVARDGTFWKFEGGSNVNHVEFTPEMDAMQARHDAVGKVFEEEYFR